MCSTFLALATFLALILLVLLDVAHLIILHGVASVPLLLGGAGLLVLLGIVGKLVDLLVAYLIILLHCVVSVLVLTG